MTIAIRMSNTEYRASEGLSYSESKLLLRSPAHYRWWKDNPQASKPSPAMIFGTLMHCALLEPTEFDTRYAVVPDISKNSRDYKQIVAELALQGLTPITRDDRTWAFEAAESLKRHPRVGPLLEGGMPEVSCWWTDTATGIECKARLDWVNERPPAAILLDVKTTADAAREAFARSVVNFQYHRQAAWYEDGYALASGLGVSPMLFAVVESSPPFACAAYTLDKWFMAQARKVNTQARALYAHCMAMNDWPGYDPTITDLVAPRWALDDELRDERREEEYA